ncbi:zonular occludens toxin domain-containing protein [Lysobacter sp. A6]|uniref:Zonular occludens toxin domain-containing protein n=1 Tax=Noviluteimonas lactosilytica TaxID=2888523 RepID=A0ABS8JIF8_9GAMM|nr:zonular occludens toxin domain-containing protein [Lysobacter lactosilyticus]MCC8363253.1 zonular occludens toxin domain-containing protein [Lysobacter lactosilyticus]
MLTWFTGQPGHGKTLHAIDKALDYVEQGRLVYVCNVRGFLHEKAGCLPLTPEQFKDWPNFLPDGAVCLVDEAYEHGMLPKRGPGTKVPYHVEQLAKHRHRGLDFIFVSQSPAKQVDDFVHDLIEQHVHVRRRFGLMFAHLRIFDRFERNPEKAHPILLKRVALPKRPRGLYESTVLDTSEKKVPWYYPAAAALLVAIVVGSIVVAGNVRETFANGMKPPGQEATTDGAPATAGGAKSGMPGSSSKGEPINTDEYLAKLKPRVPGMPWSAEIFDKREAVSDPEAFCVYAAPGVDAQGDHQDESCTCLTEQGTDYTMPFRTCKDIATRGGAYNPYKPRERQEAQRQDRGGGKETGPTGPLSVGVVGSAVEPVTAYGGMRGQGDGPPHW